MTMARGTIIIHGAFIGVRHHLLLGMGGPLHRLLLGMDGPLHRLDFMGHLVRTIMGHHHLQDITILEGRAQNVDLIAMSGGHIIAVNRC